MHPCAPDAPTGLEVRLDPEWCRTDESRLEQAVPPELREPSPGQKRAPDLLVGDVERFGIDRIDANRARRARPAMEQDGALAHQRHAEVAEIALPFVERGAERPAVGGKVRVPARGVVERRRLVRREDPAVAARVLDPRDDMLVRRMLVGRDPADEQRRETAVGKALGGAAYDALGELVAAKAAVAIGPAMLGRDDKRCIARDQVEGLVAGRLEEAALPALDVR